MKNILKIDHSEGATPTLGLIGAVGDRWRGAIADIGCNVQSGQQMTGLVVLWGSRELGEWGYSSETSF